MPDINTGTPLSTSLDGIFSQMRQNEQQSKEQLKPVLAKQEALSDKASTMKPPEIPAAPKMEDYNTRPMDAFGSGAGWLATFGSLLTRKHLTNALNAGATVMNSYRNKDLMNFKSAYDTWKENVQNARDKWKEEADWIKEQGGLNKDTAGMIAAATKNDTLASMAQAKMMENYIKDRDRNSNRLNATTAKMEELDYRVDADKKAKEAAGQPWTEQDENESHMRHYAEIFTTSTAQKQRQEDDLAKFDYLGSDMNAPVPGTGLTLGAISQYGEAIHRGVKPSQLGLGYSVGPVKKATENYVAAKYPHFDMAQAQIDYAAAAAAEKKLEGQAKMIDLSANILDQSLPALLDIASKYQLSDSTDLNKVYNFIQDHASDEDKANFSTQLRAVTTDYAMLISRGRSSPTVHSDEEAIKILHDNMGVSSLKGFEKAAKIEMQNIRKGVDKTRMKSAGEENKGGKPQQMTKTIDGKTYFNDTGNPEDWYEQ